MRVQLMRAAEIRTRHARRLAIALAWLLAMSGAVVAGEIVVAPVKVTDWKAVTGSVAARDVVAARTRIGGTLTVVSATEGDRVKAGDVVARVVDEKLALQARAVDARIRALIAERDNARGELERAQALLGRGVVTPQRVDQLRTQVDVLANQISAAEADRALIDQQQAEGDVRAPADGRVLRVPVTRGAVVLPGEAVASVASGGTYLRLALPERHARTLREGASVDLARNEMAATARGRLAKIYPQMEQGRVIADVEVDGLSDAFVGERILVRVPIGERLVLAIPPSAVRTQGGLDHVRVVTTDGERQIVVVLGEAVATPEGPRVEVLSGLKPGDRVVTP